MRLSARTFASMRSGKSERCQAVTVTLRSSATVDWLRTAATTFNVIAGSFTSPTNQR